MKLGRRHTVDRTSKVDRTTEQARIDRAIRRLTPNPTSTLEFPPNPFKLFTGPLRLLTMAGRKMRNNLAVTAVLAGVALGGAGVGVDYYNKTRVPTKAPSSLVVLAEELSNRVDGSERISMSDAHWSLNRLAQADDVWSLESAVDDLSPSFLAIIRSAPPGWTRHPEFRDVGMFMLEATDERALPRDDPAVRSLVDATYPEVAVAAEDIDEYFSTGERHRPADAQWLVDRLAEFGMDVREVAFRVDIDALRPAIDSVDTETRDFHAPFFDPILEVAEARRTKQAKPKTTEISNPDKAQTAPAKTYPREEALAADIENHFGDYDVLVEKLREGTDDSFAWKPFLEALGPDATRTLVLNFPASHAADAEDVLKPLLRAVDDAVVSPNDPRAVELRLRIDDIDWSVVTQRVPGFRDYAERGQLFVDGPEVDDLKQGIGTCYLTSVIASTAHMNPDYLKRIVADARTVDDETRTAIDASLPKNVRGTWSFAVRLYENQRGFLVPRWIPVEPKLPVDWVPSEGLPEDAEARNRYFLEHVFSRDRGPNGEVEIYAGLIEQACAEFERGAIPKRWQSADDWRSGSTLEGRYEKLEGGHPHYSMEWLLGTSGLRTDLDGDPDALWQTMTAALNDGNVMVAVLEGHVRAVTSCEVANGRRIVKMYDTAPGEAMTMSFEEFRLVHEYTRHGKPADGSEVEARNESTATLYLSLAALALAITLLTKSGLSRLRRAAAKKTIRNAADKGLLSMAEATKLLSLAPEDSAGTPGG